MKLPFTAPNGQCLPAALACLFNEPYLLKSDAAKPKKYGHVLPDLRYFTQMRFDVLPSPMCVHRLADGEVPIPCIAVLDRHAVLIIYEPKHKTFYLFDCVKGVTKTMSVFEANAYFDTFTTTQTAVFINDDNALVGVKIEKLGHLFDV
jgi:hypothetical protein